MFNKVKCLNKNNKIVLVSSSFGISNCKRFDIPRQLQRLTAFKLCFDTLGYIATGNTIEHNRSPIMGVINATINKSVRPSIILSRRRTQVRERVLLYCMGEKWQTLEKYHDQAVLHYRKTNKLHIDKAIHSEDLYCIAEMLRAIKLGLLPLDKKIEKF